VAGVALNRAHTRRGTLWEIYPEEVSQVSQVSHPAPGRQKPRDTSTGASVTQVSQAGASVTQVSHEKTDNQGPGDTMTLVTLLPDAQHEDRRGGGETPKGEADTHRGRGREVLLEAKRRAAELAEELRKLNPEKAAPFFQKLNRTPLEAAPELLDELDKALVEEGEWIL